MINLFAVNEMESVCKRRVSLAEGLRASRWQSSLIAVVIAVVLSEAPEILPPEEPS